MKNKDTIDADKSTTGQGSSVQPQITNKKKTPHKVNEIFKLLKEIEDDNLKEYFYPNGIFSVNKHIANSMISEYICGTDASTARILGGGMTAFYNLSGSEKIAEYTIVRSNLLIQSLQTEQANREKQDEIKKIEDDLQAAINKEAFCRLFKINMSLLVINSLISKNGVSDLFNIFDPKNIDAVGTFIKDNPIKFAIITGAILAVELIVYYHIANRAREYSDNVAIKNMIEGMEKQTSIQRAII